MGDRTITTCSPPCLLRQCCVCTLRLQAFFGAEVSPDAGRGIYLARRSGGSLAPRSNILDAGPFTLVERGETTIGGLTSSLALQQLVGVSLLLVAGFYLSRTTKQQRQFDELARSSQGVTAVARRPKSLDRSTSSASSNQTMQDHVVARVMSSGFLRISRQYSSRTSASISTGKPLGE